MYMFMCIYMYVYIYIYIYMYIHMYTYLHIYIYTSTCLAGIYCHVICVVSTTSFAFLNFVKTLCRIVCGDHCLCQRVPHDMRVSSITPDG